MSTMTVGIEALEAAMARGWWPLEHAWLGEWLLRASAGFTGRGNSALAIGDPGMPVDSAIERVEQFYRSRELPPRFAVPGPAVGDVGNGELAEVLADRGYAAVTPTAVMVAPTATVARAETTPVLLASRPDAGWLRLYRYRGQPLPPEAVPLLTGSAHQRFASLRHGGETVAVGRVAISAGWAGITAMQVDDRHQRRGLARAVLSAMAGYAGQRGVTDVYLQVAVENTAARGLYESMGFVDHHGYHYRVRPAGSSADT